VDVIPTLPKEKKHRTPRMKSLDSGGLAMGKIDRRTSVRYDGHRPPKMNHGKSSLSVHHNRHHRAWIRNPFA